MSIKNLEYISIENQTTDFPKHYHETFCISLIHKGTEKIDFEKSSLFCESGSISITNPFEIHANPLIDQDTPLSFDTIYIPIEAMKSVFDGKTISFTNRKITNDQANQYFLDLKESIVKGDKNLIEQKLKNFIELLKSHYEETEVEHSELDFSSFKSINLHIEKHIQEKFNLTELAKMAMINKYGFAKKFKSSTGMTPMNYILMKKIFSAKSLIKANSDLTKIAHQYNFSDLAHFSKTFKRYIGISPNSFKESL